MLLCPCHTIQILPCLISRQIKNHEAIVSQVIRRLRSQGKLLLTGTPLQNNLRELWALLNYLLPDTFRDSAPFDRAYDLTKNQVCGVMDQMRFLLLVGSCFV